MYRRPKGYWANSAKLVSSTGRLFTEDDFANARAQQNREEGGMTKALECFYCLFKLVGI
jgi:hypothetical protein